MTNVALNTDQPPASWPEARRYEDMTLAERTQHNRAMDRKVAFVLQDQFTAGANAMRETIWDMLQRRQRPVEARLVREMPIPQPPA